MPVKDAWTIKFLGDFIQSKAKSDKRYLQPSFKN